MIDVDSGSRRSQQGTGSRSNRRTLRPRSTNHARISQEPTSHRRHAW